jgi:hypothetical protein
MFSLILRKGKLISVSALIEFDSIHMEITDFDAIDWVNCICIDDRRDLLYASFDNNVAVRISFY